MGFRIIAITPENRHPQEKEAIISLLENGLDTLHLRKPLLSGEEIKEYLLNIPSAYHNRVVLHSHFNLANEFDVRGVHLNSRFPVYAEQRNVRISRSVHTLQELNEHTDKLEYVLISPVFESISKPGYGPAFSPGELGSSPAKEKLIGLGGITEHNISALKIAGLKGAAISGVLWREETVSSIINTYNKLQEAVES